MTPVIIDLAEQTPDYPPDPVIVVGSGAAGLALTERLSSAGRSVLLLESGADVTAGSSYTSADLNAGTVLGAAYAGLTDGRARTFGGTTELWHGQCMRLHEIDMLERSWIPYSGWPVGLDDLTQHYGEAERWLGVTGRGYGPERWDEHARLARIGWDPERLLDDFTEYTPKPMLGREHRAGLAADPRVQVIVNATAARITTSAGKVTGVQVLAPDGRRVEFTSGHVVLAAGAVENARLLQLSDPEGVGLGTGRQHTGRFLQDHPIVRTAQVFPTDYRVLQDRYVALHRGHERLFPKVRLSPDAQVRHGLLDVTAVFVHDHEQPALAAARRLLLAARAHQAPERPWQDFLAALRAPAPVVRDTYRRYVRGLSTGERPSQVWLQLWLEQVPDAESRISLGSDTDRLGLRRPQVRWRTSDLEIETSRRMTRWVAADLERLRIATVRALPAMHDDDAWRKSVTDAFHPSGTTRMSRDPKDGVVDTDLQVHDVSGLFVVGGSVFPIAGYANPTLTIVALALRLADRLAALAAATLE